MGRYVRENCPGRMSETPEGMTGEKKVSREIAKKGGISGTRDGIAEKGVTENCQKRIKEIP